MDNGRAANEPGEAQAMDPVEVAMALAAELEENVRARPLVTLGAAFGVGYVLGGGVPNFVLRAGGVVALRFMASRAMSELAGANRPTARDPRGPIDVEHRPDVDVGGVGSGPS